MWLPYKQGIHLLPNRNFQAMGDQVRTRMTYKAGWYPRIVGDRHNKYHHRVISLHGLLLI